MPRLDRTFFGHVMIAFAVVVAMVAIPHGPYGSHDPLHLLQAAVDDHGHSHDVDEPGDPAAHGDHQHKHNPSDHSHEKLGPLPRFDAPVPPAPVRHALAPEDHVRGGVSSPLDRPPRPSDIA